jgi:hypothetical protein
MLMQQNAISSSLGSLEEENDKIMKQQKAMEQYDPVRILKATREDGVRGMLAYALPSLSVIVIVSDEMMMLMLMLMMHVYRPNVK